MTGTVFGSFGMPLSPWQAAHSCTFASRSSARVGAAETANAMATATIVAARRAALISFLPLVIAHDCGKYPDKACREQPDLAAGVGAPSMAPFQFWGLFRPRNGVTLPQPDGDPSNQPRPKGMERHQRFFRE